MMAQCELCGAVEAQAGRRGDTFRTTITVAEEGERLTGGYEALCGPCDEYLKN